jgi:signal transduction histidine kinase
MKPAVSIRGRRPAEPGRSERTLRRLEGLKWLTVLIPASAVFLFETIRHSVLEGVLPETYGNLVVGAVALILAFGFSQIIFSGVRHIHLAAVAEEERTAALAATIQERERLSRELHDGLAQLVAYLSVRIDTVIEMIRADQRAEALQELERLRGVSDDLYTDVRESISGLRARVTERGLVAALTDYVDEFEERHGLTVTFDASRLPVNVPALAELELFRIVQEALTNIRKHSGATHAAISLELVPPQSIELIVADDGVGFGPSTPTSPEEHTVGLATMRERAEGLGGWLRIDSSPSTGSRVIVRLPVLAGRV